MQNYLLSPGEHFKGMPSAILNDDNDEIMVQTHPEVFLQLNSEDIEAPKVHMVF